MLYWWPDEGWQLGRVHRRSGNSDFSGYRDPGRLATAAFPGEVDSLLDAAASYYGSRSG